MSASSIQSKTWWSFICLSSFILPLTTFNGSSSLAERSPHRCDFGSTWHLHTPGTSGSGCSWCFVVSSGPCSSLFEVDECASRIESYQSDVSLSSNRSIPARLRTRLPGLSGLLSPDCSTISICTSFELRTVTASSPDVAGPKELEAPPARGVLYLLHSHLDRVRMRQLRVLPGLLQLLVKLLLLDRVESFPARLGVGRHASTFAAMPLRSEGNRE